MKIDIPFELGELVYVIDKEKDYKKEYVRETSRDIGVDWVHVAQYTTRIVFRKVVKCVNFKFGLLDKYKSNEIFRSRQDAEKYLSELESENE